MDRTKTIDYKQATTRTQILHVTALALQTYCDIVHASNHQPFPECREGFKYGLSTPKRDESRGKQQHASFTSSCSISRWGCTSWSCGRSLASLSQLPCILSLKMVDNRHPCIGVFAIARKDVRQEIVTEVALLIRHYPAQSKNDFSMLWVK